MSTLSEFCSLLPCNLCAFQHSCALRSQMIGWKGRSFLSENQVCALVDRCSKSPLSGGCTKCKFGEQYVDAFAARDFDLLRETIKKATRL